MSDDIKLPPATLCEVRYQATGERQVSDHDDAYYDSEWFVARPIYTADEVRAAILADRKSETERLQQQCSDWGAYWRASDAHGVDLMPSQAEELLRDVLGVEVSVIVLPADREARGEPAAWRVDAMYWSKFDSIPPFLRDKAEPLYAAPQPPEAA